MATLLPIWAATGTVLAPDATKISVGWLLGEKPPHEFMNWWQQEMILRLNHILVQGVPEWDATTPYPLNAHTKRLGLVYRATAANTNSRPPSANWLQVSQNASALTTGVVANERISGAYNGFTTITASSAITAGSSIITGGVIAHSSGNLSLRTGTSATNRLMVTDNGITVAGTATATTFAGSGSGLTALNASNLASGTVPNARISGSYTNFLSIVSNVLHANGDDNYTPLVVQNSSDVTAAIRFITPAGDCFAGMATGAAYFVVSDTLSLQAGANQRFRVTLANGNINWQGVASGDGSGISSLNASNLASGTVPNARISGAYSGFTNITASGTINAGGTITAGSSITVGGVIAHAAGNLTLRTGTSGTNRLTITDAGITVSGTATATTFAGSGASLTALNASQLTTGTVPSARIAGAYTGFTNITASGTITANVFSGSGMSAFQGNTADTTALPSFTWTGDLDTGIWRPAADQVGVTVGGSTRLLVTQAVVQAANGAVFSGPGGSITALNASQLTTGTVSNACISGAYSGFTNITASGTITAAVFNGTGGSTFQGNANDTEALPSFTWTGDLDTGIWRPSAGAIGFVSNGSMRLRVGADILAQNGAVFGGPGTDLTDLNATQLLRGTIPTARLGVAGADRDWVGARYAAIPLGAIGSVATMYVGSGGGGQAPGATYPASALYYASSGGGESSGRSTTQPSTGTWRAEGAVGWRGGNSDGGEERRMTTLKRIS